MTEPTQPPERLSSATWVPVGLVATVIASAITGSIWLNSRLMHLAYSIEKVEIRLADLNVQVTAMNNSAWTLADMRAWVALAAAKNVSLQLPEPTPVHGGPR